jgi:hypothetical protein
MTCNVLGNPSGSQTLVEIGVDQRLRTLSKARVGEIQRNQKKIELVRTKIAPLMAHPKLLTAEQKETATALLYDASQLEEKTQDMIKQLRDAVTELGQPQNPELIVKQMIHPGVTIRFMGGETKIDALLRGPVKISAKTSGFNCKLLITNMSNGANHFAKTVLFTDPEINELRRVIAEPAKKA